MTLTNVLIIAAETIAFISGVLTIIGGLWFVAAIYGG